MAGSAGRLGAVGLELGGCIIGGLLAGKWLDDYFLTAPWIALAGLVLGSVAGFRGLIRALRIHEAAEERRK